MVGVLNLAFSLELVLRTPLAYYHKSRILTPVAQRLYQEQRDVNTAQKLDYKQDGVPTPST